MSTQKRWRNWLLFFGGFACLSLAVYVLWFLSSRPTHSAHIKDADMVGVFVADTQSGKTRIALNKNHALRSVLIERDGYVLKQSTGWWKLIRQPDGQQQLEYDGAISRCFSGDGSVCIFGQTAPINDVGGKIVIYSDLGRFEKQ